jgi:hypothetical protein
VGDLFAGSSGELQVRVRAAPWVPVSKARVYVNAELEWEGPVTAGGKELRVPLSFDGDSFVVVEVEGEPDEVFSAIAPEFRSFAFTNPLFVDAEGDGRWVAPGFSMARPPDTLANPSRTRPRRRGGKRR